MFIEFAERHDLMICNTWFKQHKRKLYTWISPGNRVRNQIGYILVNSRFKNAVKNCHTYPGADCNSDHKLLVAKCQISMNNQKKDEEGYQQLDIAKIKSKHVQRRFQQELEKQKEDAQNEGQDIEEISQTWKRKVKRAAENAIPKRRKRPHKPWMTEEILDLMEQRRRTDRPSSEYTRLHKDIQKMCTVAKSEWYAEKCH